jgi:hypothetical protein
VKISEFKVIGRSEYMTPTWIRFLI